MARNFTGPIGGDGIDWGVRLDLNLLDDMSMGVWIKLANIAGSPQSGTAFQRGATSAVTTPGPAQRNYSLNFYTQHINYGHNYGAQAPGPPFYQGGVFLTFGSILAYDTWYYIGISRNSATSTVYAYSGTGTTFTTYTPQTYLYPPNDIDTGLMHVTSGGEYTHTDSDGGIYGAFQGSIGDSLIYNRVLSADEHEAIFNCVVPQQGLVFWTRHPGATPELDIVTNSPDDFIYGTTVVPFRTCASPPYIPPSTVGCIIGDPASPAPTGTIPPLPSIWPFPTGWLYGQLQANQDLIRLNTYTFHCAAVANGGSVDLSSASLICTGKLNYDDEDDAAIFKKTLLDGITITNAALGLFTVKLSPEDTEPLPQHESYVFYDVKLITGDEAYCILRGVLLVRPEVTTAEA